LYHKNGTINEERFRSLSPPQWLFHYCEIKKALNDKYDIEKRFLKKLVNSIQDAAKFLSYFSNYKMAKQYEETEQIEKERKELPAEKFGEFFEELKEMIPETLTVIEENQQQEIQLPKMSKKKLGIN